MPSMDLLYRIAAALDVSVADVFSIVENRAHDEQQLMLNSLYIALPERDRALLLSFAGLLQARDQQEPADLPSGTALPSLFGDSTNV